MCELYPSHPPQMTRQRGPFSLLNCKSLFLSLCTTFSCTALQLPRGPGLPPELVAAVKKPKPDFQLTNGQTKSEKPLLLLAVTCAALRHRAPVGQYKYAPHIPRPDGSWLSHTTKLSLTHRAKDPLFSQSPLFSLYPSHGADCSGQMRISYLIAGLRIRVYRSMCVTFFFFSFLIWFFRLRRRPCRSVELLAVAAEGLGWRRRWGATRRWRRRRRRGRRRPSGASWASCSGAPAAAEERTRGSSPSASATPPRTPASAAAASSPPKP